MWPIWLIIAVAVAGAVTMTVTTVLTVVYFERRRHRKLMAQHELSCNTSQMHRHHLSATDVDTLSNISRPAKSLRHSYQRPRSASFRFYATIPSQDEIRTFPEGTITDSVVGFPYCQPEASYASQWLSPNKSGRFKRKKKVAKVSISAPIAKSPMSAITEATESSRRGSPEPVELPAQATPKMTPEGVRERCTPVQVKNLRNSMISIDRILGAPQRDEKRISCRISHGNTIKSRSLSTGSIMPPPDVPLPPVPSTEMYKSQRQASVSRSKSDVSLHQRHVSTQILPLSPEPLHIRSKPSDALSGFRLELAEDYLPSSSKRQIPPSSGTDDCASGADTGTLKQNFYAQSPDDTFRTIDASTWNLPNPLRLSRPITPTFSAHNSEAGSRSVSMIDYDAIFSAGSSLENSPTKPHEGPLSRPVSALSMSNVEMVRLSILSGKSPESPRIRGHRRQNCVRIKNLTPVDAKKRLSSQLSRLAEADEGNAGVSPTSTMKARPNQNALTDNSSPTVPIIGQPQALSLRVKRPGWTSIKDKKQLGTTRVPCAATETAAGLVKASTDNVARSNDGIRLVNATDLAPTVLEATKISEAEGSVSPASPARGFNLISPQRRRTQIQGPRNAPPPSLRTRNADRTGSPLRRKSSENDRINKQRLYQQRERKASDADLQRSIDVLKNMTLPQCETRFTQNSSGIPTARTPSSRYADSPTIKVGRSRMRSQTIAGYSGEQAQSSLVSSLDAPDQQQKGDPLNVQTRTRRKVTCSTSSISIWEDASVKGDSPEPAPRQVTTPAYASVMDQKSSSERQRHGEKYSPVKSRRDHFDQLSMYSGKVTAQQQYAQIQRESLWKLQQNADVVTSRTLALGGANGGEKLSQGKRVASPKAKLQGFYEGVPTGFRGITRDREGGRVRSQTVSATTKPSVQTACEGVGLGLKFGEKSMAYTINEMNTDGIGRLR